MRQIYRKIAKKNGVSVAHVQKEMQLAISEAYKNTRDDGGVIQIYQNQVERNGDIPTTDELIRFATDTVKRRNESIKDKEGDL
jgi:hypothetical protein